MGLQNVERTSLGMTSSASDLADKFAKAAFVGNRLLKRKAEDVSGRIISDLVKRNIIMTYLAVSTFFVLHLGFQYALTVKFPMQPQIATSFFAALGVLVLILIVFGILSRAKEKQGSGN